ncbi:hypothetical protein TrLO_g14262 [Triparma laevis f. longispina]|uniref:Uncharacterized protein n=1 Tax=Triparma laevis f. longispina TaxID=1714387 RepID=A0A9W7DM50_9STRA|nr:hypothetical protein TrLO_g14262 [Triparma laevis f. longispina]
MSRPSQLWSDSSVSVASLRGSPDRHDSHKQTSRNTHLSPATPVQDDPEIDEEDTAQNDSHEDNTTKYAALGATAGFILTGPIGLVLGASAGALGGVLNSPKKDRIDLKSMMFSCHSPTRPKKKEPKKKRGKDPAFPGATFLDTACSASQHPFKSKSRTSQHRSNPETTPTKPKANSFLLNHSRSNSLNSAPSLQCTTNSSSLANSMPSLTLRQIEALPKVERPIHLLTLLSNENNNNRMKKEIYKQLSEIINDVPGCGRLLLISGILDDIICKFLPLTIPSSPAIRQWRGDVLELGILISLARIHEGSRTGCNFYESLVEVVLDFPIVYEGNIMRMDYEEAKALGDRLLGVMIFKELDVRGLYGGPVYAEDASSSSYGSNGWRREQSRDSKDTDKGSF